MLGKALEESRGQVQALLAERAETSERLAEVLEALGPLSRASSPRAGGRASAASSPRGAASPVPAAGGDGLLLGAAGEGRAGSGGSSSGAVVEALRRRVGRLKEQLQFAEVEAAGGPTGAGLILLAGSLTLL